MQRTVVLHQSGTAELGSQRPTHECATSSVARDGLSRTCLPALLLAELDRFELLIYRH